MLNIDACRIDFTGPEDAAAAAAAAHRANGDQAAGRGVYETGFADGPSTIGPYLAGIAAGKGRWPANVLLDAQAAAQLDAQSGELASGGREHEAGDSNQSTRNGIFANAGSRRVHDYSSAADSGGASRFFYVAKPSREERDYGTEHLTSRQRDESRKDGHRGGDNPRNRGLQPRGNYHPTVKPIELMRWLIKLVTPLGGLVLDPFTGSGTTGMACRYEQRRFLGIEREPEYLTIATNRIGAVTPLFG